MLDCLHQLELLHHLSARIEEDEQLLTSGNRTIRSLLEDQLSILSGKNNKASKNGNGQLLIEEIKVKIKIHQVEIDEISRNLGSNKNKQEQVLATSLESLRELIDSDFNKEFQDIETGKQMLVLLDAAISSLERIGKALGGDWLFRIQLVRKLFYEKVSRLQWLEAKNIEIIREWGVTLFSRYQLFTKKVEQEAANLKDSLSFVSTQRYALSVDEISALEDEVTSKFEELESLCYNLAESSPVNPEHALDWLDTFILRYATFRYISLDKDKENIRDIFTFCRRCGGLYDNVLEVFKSRKQFLSDLRIQFAKDEKGLLETERFLQAGQIKEAEKLLNSLSKKFSDLKYEKLNKEISRYLNIRSELDKAVEQISMTTTEPNFLQLTFNRNPITDKKIEESFQRLLKKVDSLPDGVFKENVRNDILEHLRYLSGRENVQQESRFVARFALLFLILGIIGFSSYWAYNYYNRDQQSQNYIHLDEILADEVTVWIAGSFVEAEQISGTNKVRYGMPSSSELVIFKSADQGDITLDVNMYGADFLDMTAEVLAILEGKEKSDIQDILHRSLNDHVSIKNEYESTLALINKMEARKERAVRSLDKYFDKYPHFKKEVRMKFVEESSIKEAELKKKLEIHAKNQEILNRELREIQEEAVSAINEHILDNVLLIPSLGQSSISEIFHTDFTSDTSSISSASNVGDGLVVSRVIQNDLTLADPTSGRKQRLIYLPNFPSQISDRELRSRILELYQKWNRKKKEFEDKEAILQLKLDQHLDVHSRKKQEFQQFESIIHPLVQTIEDIDRLLPEEKSRAEILKKKLEKLGSNVLELKEQIETNPDLLLFN